MGTVWCLSRSWEGGVNVKEKSVKGERKQSEGTLMKPGLVIKA